MRVRMKKTLAIGIESYKEIIDESYYYIDKTWLIVDLLNQKGKVNLFTRPRRFGKTLTLDMLKTFFEKELDKQGKPIDNQHYFTGMKIMNAGEKYLDFMGKYPVISLSLKSAKQPDFVMAYSAMAEQLAGEYKRHSYILNGDILLSNERERFEALMMERASRSQLSTSIKFLSDCLKKYHGENIVILIDEYDVPLENAYFRGFYNEMIDFIRSLFESALKTSDSLAFAVVTGCLRISRESIFTELNNLKITSLLNNDYAEYFGFTQAEVDEMLAYYELSDKTEEVKNWYDGYLFGQTEVYNPWSMINYVYDQKWGGLLFPKPYWSNTSSNNIIRDMIEKADSETKNEIEKLIDGGVIVKSVHEEITYGDIYTSKDNLWNFLFFTGYLKMAGQEMEGNQVYLTLKIPNEEIRYIYQNTIKEWFDNRIQTFDLPKLYRSMLDGDNIAFGNLIKTYLRETISYHDTKESFYHGFLIGLLGRLKDYQISSNRESGMGRPDIILKPYDELCPAVIIEIKSVSKFTLMEKGCEAALAQIEDKHYDESLIDEGYEKIMKYGICFCKKSCMVKKME